MRTSFACSVDAVHQRLIACLLGVQETLEQGCKSIDECVQSFEDVATKDRSMVWNTDLVETLELENLLINATVTMHSAEQRKVSPKPVNSPIIAGGVQFTTCRPILDVAAGCDVSAL